MLGGRNYAIITGWAQGHTIDSLPQPREEPLEERPQLVVAAVPREQAQGLACLRDRQGVAAPWRRRRRTIGQPGAHQNALDRQTRLRDTLLPRLAVPDQPAPHPRVLWATWPWPAMFVRACVPAPYSAAALRTARATQQKGCWYLDGRPTPAAPADQTAVGVAPPDPATLVWGAIEGELVYRAAATAAGLSQFN